MNAKALVIVRRLEIAKYGEPLFTSFITIFVFFRKDESECTDVPETDPKRNTKYR